MAKYKGFNGLDEYLDALDVCMRKAPGRCIEELRRESRQVVNAYRRRVKPHSITGNLAKGIKANKNIEKQGDKYNAFIEDNYKKAPHFHLVERGHDLVKGGRKGRGGRVIGKVQGKKYFEKTLEEEEPKLQKRRERELEKIFRELE